MNSFVSRAKKNAAYAQQPQQPAQSSASPLPAAPISAGGKTAAAPSLSGFLSTRDYTGALAVIEWSRAHGRLSEAEDELQQAWLAYAAFHLGDYRRALDAYTQLADRARQPLKEAADEEAEAGDEDEDGQQQEQRRQQRRLQTSAAAASSAPRPPPEQWLLYAACCHFYLGEYAAADSVVSGLPASPLSGRLQLHLAHRLGDEPRLLKWSSKLSSSSSSSSASPSSAGSSADSLSLASLQYARNRYQEATDAYKSCLLQQRDWTALQLYVSMCYYKLDYYDVSLEILAPYTAAHPDSLTALNLKACNHYKLYDGKAAEAELRPVLEQLSGGSSSSASLDNDLIRHNLVVFRNGEAALSTLTPLLSVIPEARLNLAIHHLRAHQVEQAEALMRELQPSTPQEYILKGVVSSAVGQLTDSRPHLKAAQEFFQLVGASASECDTIPGRQCMASCFFLLKQFDDVLIYLNSIRQYAAADSGFQFNLGLALAATEQFAEALEALQAVTEPRTRSSYTFLSWLARCLIMTGQARAAWELYLRMDSNSDSFSLLQLIANDCYKVGLFFYSAKAFDVLERLDPAEPAYWDGKRGAAVGVLQAVMAKKERKDCLRDLLSMLKDRQGQPEHSTQQQQADAIVRAVKRFAADNAVSL